MKGDVTPEEAEHFQKYLDQMMAYYRPERVGAIVDYPVPAFQGLTRRQLFQAGLGDKLMAAEQAIARSWDPVDLAHYGLTPEALVDAKHRLGLGGEDG